MNSFPVYNDEDQEIFLKTRNYNKTRFGFKYYANIQ